MKKVEAIVQPHRVSAIREALLGIGVSKITLLEAKTIGNQKSLDLAYRGVKYQEEYLSKLKMEVVVPEQLAEATIASIVKADYSVRPADGDILISNVEAPSGVRIEGLERHAV